MCTGPRAEKTATSKALPKHKSVCDHLRWAGKDARLPEDEYHCCVCVCVRAAFPWPLSELDMCKQRSRHKRIGTLIIQRDGAECANTPPLAQHNAASVVRCFVEEVHVDESTTQHVFRIRRALSNTWSLQRAVCASSRVAAASPLHRACIIMLKLRITKHEQLWASRSFGRAACVGANCSAIWVTTPKFSAQTSESNTCLRNAALGMCSTLQNTMACQPRAREASRIY